MVLHLYPATFLCLSQVRIWISNAICHGLFYVEKFDYHYLSFLIVAFCIVQDPVFVGVLFSWISRKSRDFDRDVTFTRVLAVTRKWNIAVQYAVKTGKFTYNCITTMNFLTNFIIAKFYLCILYRYRYRFPS